VSRPGDAKDPVQTERFRRRWAGVIRTKAAGSVGAVAGRRTKQGTARHGSRAAELGAWVRDPTADYQLPEIRDKRAGPT